MDSGGGAGLPAGVPGGEGHHTALPRHRDQPRAGAGLQDRPLHYTDLPQLRSVVCSKLRVRIPLMRNHSEINLSGFPG